MAGTETIEEIDERNPSFNGSQMGNACQVHDFLGIGFCQHGAAGGPGAHHVLVVTEMERAWLASARAAMWNTPGSSSPATLYIFGIMRSIPWDAV